MAGEGEQFGYCVTVKTQHRSKLQDFTQHPALRKVSNPLQAKHTMKMTASVIGKFSTPDTCASCFFGGFFSPPRVHTSTHKHKPSVSVQSPGSCFYHTSPLFVPDHFREFTQSTPPGFRETTRRSKQHQEVQIKISRLNLTLKIFTAWCCYWSPHSEDWEWKIMSRLVWKVLSLSFSLHQMFLYLFIYLFRNNPFQTFINHVRASWCQEYFVYH